MMRRISTVSAVSVGICLSWLGVSHAQTGAHAAAAAMNQNPALYPHNTGFVGPEVSYWSSGPASEGEAKRAWMNSPGHRRLLAGGQITEIACNGNYCVGRGPGTGGFARSSYAGGNGIASAAQCHSAQASGNGVCGETASHGRAAGRVRLFGHLRAALRGSRCCR